MRRVAENRNSGAETAKRENVLIANLREVGRGRSSRVSRFRDSGPAPEKDQIRIYEFDDIGSCSLCKRAILAGEFCTLGVEETPVCRDCLPFIQTTWIEA